jgi:uncharacterized protein
MDGPRFLHDNFWKDKSGQGSFERVLRASKLLRKHKVSFTTLTCANRVTAKHPLEVYWFLRDTLKSKRIQFIPIVEPLGFRQVAPRRWDMQIMPELGKPRARPGTEGSVVEEWSDDPDDWGDFLCRVFDKWYQKDLGKLHVNYFDAAVETWMGHVSPLCTQGPMCGKGLALERDGSVLCLRPLCLSRILRRQLAGAAAFGECPKNRFIKTPKGEVGLNYLCSGWKKKFSHIDQRPCRKSFVTAG